MLLLVYKALHGFPPKYLTDLVQPYKQTRKLRSANKILLQVPKTKLKSFGDRAFSAIGPRLWNDLPLKIREQPSTELFKSSLKTHLYGKAFL